MRRWKPRRARCLTALSPSSPRVNGAAMGGGFELALAADFIYASEEARFGLTETTLGIMPGMGGTQLLARRAGGRAGSGAYFFRQNHIRLRSVRARHRGVHLCRFDTLLKEARETAAAIAANAPLAVRAVKRAINEGARMPLREAMAHELKLYNGLLGSYDRYEGVNAFNEKRKPVFTGK